MIHRLRVVARIPARLNPGVVYLRRVGPGAECQMACPAPDCSRPLAMNIGLWEMTIHKDLSVTLHPSVHAAGHPWKCGHHFNLVEGRVHWCEDPAVAGQEFHVEQSSDA